MSSIEALTDGQEAGVGQHGQEVRGGLSQGDDQGVLVSSLVADIVEAAAGQVLIGADNVGAALADQPLQTGLGVEHVVEAGDEVVGGHSGILGALGGVPLGILTDVEGVGQAVLGDLPGVSQTGLHGAEVVVLDKAVHAVDRDLGIGLGRGVQPVDGDRSGLEGRGVGSSLLVAHLGQHGGGVIGALTGNSSFPGSLHLIALGGGQEVVSGNNDRAKTVVVIAPVDIGDSTVSHTADRVGTVLGGHGLHDGGVKQRSLSLSKEHEALVRIRRSVGRSQQIGKLFEVGVVDILVITALVDGVVSERNRSQAENHGQSEKQCEKFLHWFFLLIIFKHARNIGRFTT